MCDRSGVGTRVESLSAKVCMFSRRNRKSTPFQLHLHTLCIHASIHFITPLDASLIAVGPSQSCWFGPGLAEPSPERSENRARRFPVGIAVEEREKRELWWESNMMREQYDQRAMCWERQESGGKSWIDTNEHKLCWGQGRVTQLKLYEMSKNTK